MPPEPIERERFTITGDGSGLDLQWVIFARAGKVHVNPPQRLDNGEYEAELHVINGQAQVVINKVGQPPTEKPPNPAPNPTDLTAIVDEVIRHSIEATLNQAEPLIRSVIRDELESLANHLLATYGNARERQQERALTQDVALLVEEGNHAAIAVLARVLLQELAERSESHYKTRQSVPPAAGTIGDTPTDETTTIGSEEPC